jgi:hypothetical protein
MGFSLEDEIYSEQNINVIEEHLQSHFPDAYDLEFAPFNLTMVERQRSILNGVLQPTEYDINWMRHELIENALMVNGVDYDEAHMMANEVLGIEGDWDLWPTEIIEQYPDWLIGPAWVEPLRNRSR